MDAPNYEYKLLDSVLLLAPFEGQDVVGRYLLYDPIYDRVSGEVRKEARFQSQLLYDMDLPMTDWQSVRNNCINILQQHSKDLQIGVWLVHAMLKINGIAGMKEALQLIHELIFQYWENIYPYSETDPEVKLSPFIWMSEKLPVELYLTDLAPYRLQRAQVFEYSKEAFNLYEIERYENMAQNNDKNDDDDDDIEKKYLQFSEHAPHGWHQSIISDLTDCQQILEKIKRYLQLDYSVEAPDFKDTQAIIEQLINLYKKIASEQKEVFKEQEILKEQKTLKEQEELKEQKKLIETDFLFDQLQEIAIQLIKKYKHCPTGYLVKQAINYRSYHLDAVSHILEKKDLPE